MISRIWSWSFCLLLLAFVNTILSREVLANHEDQAQVEEFLGNGDSQGHTNNWAVLVCASRYWFNYRHMANTLAMYRTVKRLGIPDSNIILMLADDAACNARNKFPATVFANADRHSDLYGDNIEVDYRGYEVTVESFIRLLTGRVSPTLPRSKRLLTDSRSNVFVYMTGHGGNEFLKFQDNEEISAFDIADAFEQMWQKKRYKELLFMIDTCQANTMYSKFYSPNILATGSSELNENSYSHHNDADIGVAVIDSYTHYVLQYLEGINKTSKATLKEFFNMYDFTRIKSHAGVRSDLYPRPLDQVLVTDFFGSVTQVDVLSSSSSTSEDECADMPLLSAVEASGSSSISVGTRAAHTGAAVSPPLPSPLAIDLKAGPGTPYLLLSSTVRAWGAAAIMLGVIIWRASLGR